MQIGRFDFRVLPTLVVLAMLSVLLYLGHWQWTKAGIKRQMIDTFDQAGEFVPWSSMGESPARYARVQLRGHYLGARQVLMDGLSRNGVPGVQVLSPFLTESGDVVVVNRGWRPFEGTRDGPVAPAPPEGAQTLTGRVRDFARPGLRLGEGNQSVKPTWPRLAIYPSADEISTWIERPVADVLVLLDAEAPGGFVREWRPDGFPPSRHTGYAVQWFSLATALVILYLIACRRPQRVENA